MRVETIFRPSRFGDLKPGTFFKVLRAQDHYFGLTALNSRKALCTLIFSESPGQMGVPWYSGDGDLYGTILAIPDAVLRPDQESMVAADGSITIGALVSDPAGSYIRGSAGIGSTFTVDLSTGSRVDLKEEHGSPVIYKRWSVGTMIDGEFMSLFSFPLPVK